MCYVHNQRYDISYATLYLYYLIFTELLLWIAVLSSAITMYQLQKLPTAFRRAKWI